MSSEIYQKAMTVLRKNCRIEKDGNKTQRKLDLSGISIGIKELINGLPKTNGEERATGIIDCVNAINDFRANTMFDYREQLFLADTVIALDKEHRKVKNGINANLKLQLGGNSNIIYEIDDKTLKKELIDLQNKYERLEKNIDLIVEQRVEQGIKEATNKFFNEIEFKRFSSTLRRRGRQFYRDVQMHGAVSDFDTWLIEYLYLELGYSEDEIRLNSDDMARYIFEEGTWDIVISDIEKLREEFRNESK